MRYFNVLVCVVMSLVLSGCSLKPKLLTQDEIAEAIKEDKEQIAKLQVPVAGDIDIFEAMARSLISNLEYRVQLLEQAVAQGQFDMAKLDMQPLLRASGNVAHRAPGRASNSESVATSTQSLVSSTSEQEERAFSDLTFSWNVIDFGVSYYQAKQESNRVLIARELRRKAMHAMIARVREAFWRAVAAKKLKEPVDDVIVHINAVLRRLDKVYDAKLQPPLATLQLKRSLIDIKTEMRAIKDELERAEVDLAMLMNIPLKDGYRLSIGSQDLNLIPSLELNVEDLEYVALHKRPELREEMYRSRISVDETKKMIVRMLPGIELRGSYNYDSNQYLVDQFWREASTQITGNLLDVINFKTRYNVAKVQEELSKQKRLALQVAILSQVHIASRQYFMTRNKLVEARNLSNIDAEIMKLVDINAQNDAEIEVEQIRTRASAINTKLQEFQAYSELQNSYGTLLTSLGFDVADVDYVGEDVNALASALEDSFMKLKGSAVKQTLLRSYDGDAEQTVPAQEENLNNNENPDLAAELDRNILPAAGEGLEEMLFTIPESKPVQVTPIFVDPPVVKSVVAE